MKHVSKFESFHFELLDAFASDPTQSELTVEFDTPSMANTYIRQWNYFVKAIEAASRDGEESERLYWSGKLLSAERITAGRAKGAAVTWRLRDSGQAERALKALQAALASKTPS